MGTFWVTNAVCLSQADSHWFFMSVAWVFVGQLKVLLAFGICFYLSFSNIPPVALALALTCGEDAFPRGGPSAKGEEAGHRIPGVLCGRAQMGGPRRGVAVNQGKREHELSAPGNQCVLPEA